MILGLLLLLGKRGEEVGWIQRAVCREFADYQKGGISLECIENAWKNLRGKKEYRRYKIIDSKVYGQSGRIKNLLERLVETGPVPDVDFIYYHEDRIKKSFVKRRPWKYAAPIFVSAKDKSLTQFILFSDYLYDPKDEKGGWNFVLKQVNEAQIPWETKEEKLFWRGSAFDGKHFEMYTFDNWTTIPRGRLVFESQKHPDLIDAHFSGYPAPCLKRDLARCLREMGPESFVSQQEQLKYKYHILIDGVTCTFPGTHWKLLSGSACFKQDSRDILYFYPELKAWVHYIPVKNDLSDLLDKIAWAKAHDPEVRQIALNSREFALTHLMPEHILEYCREILIRYAALQRFKPTLDSSD